MRSGRGVGVVAVLVVGMVAIVVLASGDRSNNRPLDPASTGPLGVKALVALLDDFGGSVEVLRSVPDASTDTAVLLSDVMGDADRDELRQWVEDGGTLLVADPTSSLVPLTDGVPVAPRFDDEAELLGTPDRRPPGGCTEAALDGVDELVGLEGRFLGGPDVTAVFGDEIVRCFASGVVVVARGEGHLVGVSSPWVFANGLLGEGDNAELAVAVLAPDPDTRVALLRIQRVRALDDAPVPLSTLVSDHVWLLLVQLGVAAVLVALWQGRRLGRPVPEPQLVEVEGAELTVALGRFLERSRQPAHGAALLRAQARRELGRRVGLPATAPEVTLAALVAPRVGAEPDELVALLGTTPVSTSEGLGRLAARLDDLRDRLDHPYDANPIATDPIAADPIATEPPSSPTT